MNKLTVKEMLIILEKLRDEPFGYSKDDTILKLQIKLSIMLEVARKMEDESYEF